MVWGPEGGNKSEDEVGARLEATCRLESDTAVRVTGSATLLNLRGAVVAVQRLSTRDTLTYSYES